MIRTLKSATNIPELLFVCREYGILPILTESVFLGMSLTRVLYDQYPDAKLAFLDSNMLLEVVSYDDESELRQYVKSKEFDIAYTVDKEGLGTPIEC